jgi:YbbR domain-containing protein
MNRLVEIFGMIKEYAKDYILENTGLKVLALLITGVIWLSVASRPINRIAIRDVPIELRNLPDSPKLTVSKYDTLSAQVYLSGPSDAVGAIRPSELTVYADLAGVEPGVRVITLHLDDSRLPASVKEEGIEPRSIRLTVEPEVEREVQVKPRFEGEPPEGYEIISQQIVPPTVRIVGAASHVRDITEVSTETVVLSDKTAPFSQRVTIDIGSPNVSISSKDPSKVQLAATIGEVRKERVFDRVVVTLVGASPSAQPIPKFVRVTVFGARSAVDAMKPEDLTVEVDLSDAQLKSGPFTPVARVAEAYSNLVEVRSIDPQAIRVKY